MFYCGTSSQVLVIDCSQNKKVLVIHCLSLVRFTNQWRVGYNLSFLPCWQNFNLYCLFVFFLEWFLSSTSNEEMICIIILSLFLLTNFSIQNPKLFTVWLANYKSIIPIKGQNPSLFRFNFSKYSLIFIC